MIRINFYVTKELLRILKKISKGSGVPYAEIIRRSVEQYLKEKKFK